MQPKISKLTFLEDDNSSVDSETEVEELTDVGDSEYISVQNIRQRISDHQKAYKIEPISGDKYYKAYDFPQPEDEKYLVLYRGVRYSTSFFSNKSRRKASHFVEQNGRDFFSSAIYRNADLRCTSIGDYIADELSQEARRSLLEE